MNLDDLESFPWNADGSPMLDYVELNEAEDAAAWAVEQMEVWPGLLPFSDLPSYRADRRPKDARPGFCRANEGARAFLD
jgi:hypothetical protein